MVWKDDIDDCGVKGYSCGVSFLGYRVESSHFRIQGLGILDFKQVWSFFLSHVGLV
jgi:hypothetical protein